MKFKVEDIQQELNALYDQIAKETTPKGLDLINKIVDLEIKAEEFCSK